MVATGAASLGALTAGPIAASVSLPAVSWMSAAVIASTAALTARA